MDVCKEFVVEVVQVAFNSLIVDVVSECTVVKVSGREDWCNVDPWCEVLVGGVYSFTINSSSVHQTLEAFVLTDWAVSFSTLWCGRVQRVVYNVALGEDTEKCPALIDRGDEVGLV